MGAAKWIAGLGALAIGVTFTILGIRARRAEVPTNEEFGYGRAFVAGFQIAIVANVLYSIFNYLYISFINPAFNELMLQDAMDKLQGKGVCGDQAEKVEKTMRFFISPGVQVVTGIIAGLLFGVIIALILAAFLRRPAVGLPPKQV